jgi:lipopolysaccharide/colanic/teichoic acid biosynthesis glycosyltransferase
MIVFISGVNKVEQIVADQFALEEEDYRSYLLEQLAALAKAKGGIRLKVVTDPEAEAAEGEDLDATILRRRLNSIHRLNVTFKSIHRTLAKGGVLLGKAEPHDLRKARFFRGKNRFQIFWIRLADFLVTRVFPVLPWIGPVYRRVIRIPNRPLPKCNIIGRLFYCGFKVEDTFTGDRYLYFKGVKDREPLEAPVAKALVFKQARVGRGGRIIHCYKLRTMYAYAPYIQEYIQERHKLEESGKIREDFRVNTWGQLLRRYWVDEIPMLWNWLRGDLKLVGVRPLSRAYFALYPKDLQEQRVLFTPGLIPPFYVDLPCGFEAIVESERTYLSRYQKRPIWTDFGYFWRALYNIVIRRARSS